MATSTQPKSTKGKTVGRNGSSGKGMKPQLHTRPTKTERQWFCAGRWRMNPKDIRAYRLGEENEQTPNTRPSMVVYVYLDMFEQPIQLREDYAVEFLNNIGESEVALAWEDTIQARRRTNNHIPRAADEDPERHAGVSDG